jgi:hypothetical protein
MASKVISKSARSSRSQSLYDPIARRSIKGRRFRWMLGNQKHAFCGHDIEGGKTNDENQSCVSRRS